MGRDLTRWGGLRWGLYRFRDRDLFPLASLDIVSTSARARCRAKAKIGAEFCFFHDPTLGEERAAARQAGGIARTRKVVLPADLPVKRLQTATDVVELLGETINQIRRGELDLRVSNAIGYLSGILLSAIEKSFYEERLAALETAVANSSHLNNKIFGEDGIFDFVPHSSPEPSSPNAQTDTTDPD